MTEGIIQKVFRKYTNGGIKSHLFSLSMIEQELIKEIKKNRIEPSRMFWSGYSDGVNSMVEKLIGDPK